MQLVVNGMRRDVPDGTTVGDVVRGLVETERGVAVAVDRVVVPRSSWDGHALRDGAEVEVLTAAAGG